MGFSLKLSKHFGGAVWWCWGGGGCATFFYAMQIEQRGNVHEQQKSDPLSEEKQVFVSLCSCMCGLLDVYG